MGDGANGTDPLAFDDSEVTPEVSLNWSMSDDVSLFVAYKTGYKSGGFDNSALPSATLGSGDVGPLLYESETGEGFEGGVKSMLLGGALRLNATAFYSRNSIRPHITCSNFCRGITQNKTCNNRRA